MSTPSDADLNSLYIQLLKDSKSTSYVGALTVAIVDQIMTLPQEIDLVWKEKWSLSKALYLWSRYFNLANISFYMYFNVHKISSDHLWVIQHTLNNLISTLLSLNSCQIVILVESLGTNLIMLTADVVLALRVWVLYHKSRKMLAFLILLLLGEMISMYVAQETLI
ncbi:hypothetical protein JR316_0006511 [Psilocybe cubensis]|uniref:Uncharacterized protein n=1 Tax=Psilocybe cubensis TaxID=181762 RepID=A0ACB8H2B4_PSICU|nr:hypothetical protein JR316_0006511 [Psilocybe cubensis]KAH9481981.1 hypothetical protein JR316_0006511 [Psilocybe cubensis]